MRYTLAHEIGHAIGLDHPDASGQVMGYRYEERYNELQAGDVAGAIQLYGPHLPEVARAEPDPNAVHRSPMPRHLAKHSVTRALPAPSH